jgi:hypothetical protein
MAAVRDHWNSERPQLCTVSRLGYVNPLDRPGMPCRGVAVHPHRQPHPGPGRQRDLPIDPGGLAPSVQLRRLPHADQRVAPAPQHEFLQVPDRGQGTILRRLEDALPQPPYVLLVQTPVNVVPAGGHVLGSVHHRCLTCPFGSGAYRCLSSKAHLPTSAPLSGPGHQARYPASYPAATAWRCRQACWFPADFRPPPRLSPAVVMPSPARPAFASWASCSRQGIPPSSRSAYQTAPRRPGP